MNIFNPRTGVAFVLAAAVSFATSAPSSAEFLCQAKRGPTRFVVTVRTTPCRSTETTVSPGYKNIYGNGSAGNKVVSADTTLADVNLQYKNFTVNAGVTLTVESGTVIRTTGKFINNGTINVLTGSSGGAVTGTGTVPGLSVPEQGVSFRAPEAGEIGDFNGVRTGGFGGRGLTSFQGNLKLNPDARAGGGGAGNGITSGFGGRGGGSFIVISAKAITNAASASINANGAFGNTGSGGGAGGFVILASAKSVTNAGQINALGGNGGDSTTASAPGGGGSGGIAHLIGLSITPGVVTVTGGTAGAVTGNVTLSPRAAGGGGGACANDGGAGGSVPIGAAVAPTAAVAGAIGLSIQTVVDPANLL